MKYIHIKVSTRARKEKFEQINDDHFEISVKEKAERNMANERILELVAEYFKVPKNKIRIVNGHRHPSKLILVE